MPKRKITKTDKPYRLQLTRGVWYAVDKKTRKTKSLKIQGTREEAEQLADIEWNQTDDTNAAFHKKTAEAHLLKCNPTYVTATWRTLFTDYLNAPSEKSGRPKKPTTVNGLNSFWNRKELDELRDVRLMDTTPQQIKRVALSMGRMYQITLRTVCNYALTNDYVPYRLMPDGMWPILKDTKPMSRAITLEEHEQLLKAAADKSLPIWYRTLGDRGIKDKSVFINEWRDYLNLLWLVGCSNKDGANMTAENINKRLGCLEFQRSKWACPEKHKPVRVPITPQLRTVLNRRPKSGPLFPNLTKITTPNRARIFGWFVDWLKMPKVTIHGYRYAMAERLDVGGASDKDRMNMLGHAGREMSEHYSKNSDYVPQCAEIIDGAKAA